MTLLAQLSTWINVPANTLGNFFFTPVEILPGWLSNTIISAIAGVIVLIIFKYTSNQSEIGRIRDHIKADMLTLRLFKDSINVTLKAQVRIFAGAFFLLVHAVRPMLVMIVPICLLLSQMALWYQFRPLRQGEEAVITMKLSGKTDSSWPKITMTPPSAAEITIGPVRVLSTREVLWKIKACKEGCHSIRFQFDDKEIDKELAIGDGYMRVSIERPPWNWIKILSHPWETPFNPDSVIQSISINYPERNSLTSGTDWWVLYFFLISLIFAFVFKPFLKVRI